MLTKAIETLRSCRTLALLGASAEPGRYGYKLFSALRDRYRLLPVNPKRSEIEGVACYPSYADLPDRPDAVIVALAPQVTEAVVPKLLAQGAPIVWLPPECFTSAAVAACSAAGVAVIHGVCPVASLLAMEQETGSATSGAVPT